MRMAFENGLNTIDRARLKTRTSSVNGMSTECLFAVCFCDMLLLVSCFS